jgi:sugar-specific transcriptional regulator TrmB
MTENQPRAETVSLLQDLGLKEYEARCFLALTGLSSGTAKEISDMSEVPRTRVYDAIRVLEAQGLVEVQHSSPQRFRAVGVGEAMSTLRQKYEGRIETLESSLEQLETSDESDEADLIQEVWSLTGVEGIQSRMLDLIEDADSEVVLLVVEEELLTDELYDQLEAAMDRGVRVVVGGQTSGIVENLKSELPPVEVFETELTWLMGPEDEGEVAISRLLLTDRTTLLVSSFYPDEAGVESNEQAVFANGLGNGIVVLIRRLISSGLLPRADAEA